MKRTIQLLKSPTAVLYTAISIGFMSITNAQNVSISPTGNAPDNSAALDIRDYTDKGILIPRVSLTGPTDAATIPNPAHSLLVYNTSSAGGLSPGYYYNAGTTTSPQWRRLLNSGTPSDAWLTLGNGGTNSGIHFIGTTDNRSLRFRTSNVHRMVIDSLGRVGIGTTAPERKLHITPGPLGGYPYYRSLIFSEAGGSGIYGEYIGFNAMLNTTITPNEFIKLGGGIPSSGGQRGGSVIVTDFSGNMYFQMYDAGPSFELTQSTTTYNPQIVFQSSGNVGIGTTAPAAKLEVNGDIRLRAQLGTDGLGNQTFGERIILAGNMAYGWPTKGITYLGFPYHDGAFFVPVGTGTQTSDLRLYITDDWDDRFSIWGGTCAGGACGQIDSAKIVACFLGGGNVGIGTTAPTERLDVRGRIRATFGVTTVLKDTTLNPANGDLGTQLAGILSIYDNVYARLPQNSSFTWNNQISLTSGQELVINGEGFTNGANNITATITMNSNGTYSYPSCNGGTPSKVVSRVKVWGGAKLTIQGVYIEETQDDTRPYSCAAEAGLIGVYGADVGGHNLLGPSKAPAVVSIRQSRIKSTENIVNISGENAFANINFAHVYIDRYSTRNIYAVSLFTGWNHPSCYAIVNNAILTLGSGVTNQVDPRIYYSINNRLSIDPNTARIGINCNAPQHLLHVNGDLGVNGTIYASNTTISNAVSACSDLRFKEKINPLGRTLENIMKLEGVTYFWKYKEFPERGFNDKKQIGFIAQEVEKIYPEVIYTDEAGYKSIDYSRFTPILVEAIKEQQKMIEQQQSKIEQQQNKIEQQEKLIHNQQKALSELEKNIQNQQAEIKSLNEKLNNVINHLYAEKSMETKVGKKN